MRWLLHKLGMASPSFLRSKGIVGMNRRNVEFIARNNPRHLYPNVDNKLLTKRLCGEHGIAVPKLLGVCRVQGHIGELKEFLKPYNQFVIKPDQGSGGKGILVIVDRKGEDYVKSSGQVITQEQLNRHVSNILSGLYSLGGKPDIALIEDLIHFTEDFKNFSFEGVPDIRVIVYKGYPIMSMMRLSTRDSDGKANLHQGAVGVGLHMGTGRALHAVQYAKPIKAHPDTGVELSKLVVPHWEDILYLAARGYEVAGLGYLGVDIVIDEQRGPLLLELNARPGLAIQMANGEGLAPRVEFVDNCPSGLPPEERVKRVMDHFKDYSLTPLATDPI